jgi:hypothetical protein
MFCNRAFMMVFAAGFQAAALFPPSSALAAVAPIALPPGGTVSSLPNGFSSYPGDEGITLFDNVEDFDFDGGLLSGMLRERVIKYSQVNEYHPYGGLYFDYEISLSSGDVTEFSAPGYAGLEVAVKQCGISGCGGSGANGVLAGSASRSSDGNLISFTFDGDLIGDTHSANLQLLTSAPSFVGPFAFATLEDNGVLYSIRVATPAVPEPSTWVMVILGFTGLGFAGYRRALKSAGVLAAA